MEVIGMAHKQPLRRLHLYELSTVPEKDNGNTFLMHLFVRAA